MGNEEEDVERFMKQFTSFDRNGRNRRSKKGFARKGKTEEERDASATEQPTPKKKRRRRRKDKKEKNEDGFHGQRTGNGNANTNANGPKKSKCNACEAVFPSKTKLYDHLKLFPKHALK